MTPLRVAAAPFSRAPLVDFSTTEVYSGAGADIVMESVRKRYTGCAIFPSARLDKTRFNHPASRAVDISV
jgi:hypothetical protein